MSKLTKLTEEHEDIEIYQCEDFEHFYPVAKCPVCLEEVPFNLLFYMENGLPKVEYNCFKCNQLNEITPVGYVSCYDLTKSGWLDIQESLLSVSVKGVDASEFEDSGSLTQTGGSPHHG